MSKNYIFYILVAISLGIYLNFKSNEEVVPVTLDESSKVVSVAFWNVENLFDTLDDPTKFDDDFTVKGKLKWKKSRFDDKINRLANVIAKISLEETKRPPAVFGLCEVENREVIEALINHPILKSYNYKIVHRNSPDARGIDVAMIYREGVFLVDKYWYYNVELVDENGNKKRTRDILTVKGKIDGETFFFVYNHWPSRGGGQKRTESGRIKAANVVKRYTDSLELVENKPKIVIMGDFNDDPDDKSITKGMGVCKEQKAGQDCNLVNLSYPLHQKGIGSLAYRDNWNLFDQTIVSKELLEKQNGYYALSNHVYNKEYLVNSSGRFRGYPFRTYGGGVYQGGYSDHFPIYLLLAKSSN